MRKAVEGYGEHAIGIEFARVVHPVPFGGSMQVSWAWQRTREVVDAVLESSGASLGASWGYLVAILRPSGATLGHFGATGGGQ